MHAAPGEGRHVRAEMRQRHQRQRGSNGSFVRDQFALHIGQHLARMKSNAPSAIDRRWAAGGSP